RELLVLGPVTSATLAAEQTASAGQILVTTETATRLPARAVEGQVNGYQILDWRRAPAEPVPVRTSPPGEQVDVTSLLPSDLAGAVPDNPEPRHRVATVAFVRFSGIEQLLGRGLDGAADVLDRTLREIQASCRAEGVVILAVDVDRDGAKVM